VPLIGGIKYNQIHHYSIDWFENPPFFKHVGSSGELLGFGPKKPSIAALFLRQKFVVLVFF
jgi:hypothetical protein